MPQRVVQRLAAKVPEDPQEFWLRRLDDDSRAAHRSHFERWMNWLHKQPGWETVTPRELLVRQLEADDSYVVVDLLQGYIGSLVLRKSSKEKAHSVVRSYFAHNRCLLPADPSFRIRGDRPPVQGRLTVEDIAGACSAATVRYQSIILVKFQSFLDNARLVWVNKHCADDIVSQIQSGVCPVMIQLPGRKENENDIEGRFATYFDRDAVDALTRYFEEERRWPRPGQPLWIQRDRKPLQKATLESTWLHLMRHMGRIPKQKGPIGSRYGYNLHEMRDVAASFLHVQAKAEGLDMDCIKFWSGRVGEIDPQKYDKFYNNREYTRSQYLIAAKHLNIITNRPGTRREITAGEFYRAIERYPDVVDRLAELVRAKAEAEKK